MNLFIYEFYFLTKIFKYYTHDFVLNGKQIKIIEISEVLLSLKSQRSELS